VETQRMSVSLKSYSSKHQSLQFENRKGNDKKRLAGRTNASISLPISTPPVLHTNLTNHTSPTNHTASTHKQ
jgi:hypothetical protein